MIVAMMAIMQATTVKTGVIIKVIAPLIFSTMSP